MRLRNNILIKKVATIDIGSNAIRLLVSNIIRLDGKLYHTKNSLHRVPVRLGQDSFLNSKIADSSKNKLINTIKSFKFLMEANEINEYLAYATSALRNASNGQEILDYVFRETKIKIEIISGKKESEIVASNDMTDHIGNSPNYCFVDVGGDINKIFKLSGNKYGKPLSSSKFKSTIKKLKKTSTKKMLLDLKLNPDRIDVILPAGKIYYFLMKTLSIKKIYVPKIGLADGMVKKIINSKIKF